MAAVGVIFICCAGSSLLKRFIPTRVVPEYQLTTVVKTPPPVKIDVPESSPSTDSEDPVEDAPDAPSENEMFPGEHFPESRLQLLTSEEVKSWEYKQIRYAINEIFARHGAVFKTDTIRKQFQTMSWYEPVSGRNPQSMLGFLSDIERHNLKVLGVRRKQLERMGAH